VSARAPVGATTFSEPPTACPVCRAHHPRFLLHVEGRDYWRCEACEARFLDPRQRPSPRQEREHYRTHENHPDDPGYRRFLARLATPLLARLEPGLRGLDYGCGPASALPVMLREAGHEMAEYDPFFHPDPSPLRSTYDFITCTEVAEHLHRPADELDRLDRLLRPGGWLGLMTCFQTDDERFAGWHYRRDPTHVVFYRESTLRRLAAWRGWTCEIPAKDIALLRKPAGGEAWRKDGARQQDPANGPQPIHGARRGSP
jgi:SAM-dependent methyltransferase